MQNQKSIFPILPILQISIENEQKEKVLVSQSKEFYKNVIDKLDYYVYVYSDPDLTIPNNIPRSYYFRLRALQQVNSFRTYISLFHAPFVSSLSSITHNGENCNILVDFCYVICKNCMIYYKYSMDTAVKRQFTNIKIIKRRLSYADT